MDLTPGQRDDVPVPSADAPFAEKMAYYRSQHTTKGVRLTHLVGIPGVAFSMPVILARPRLGLPVFGLSWALQVLGHKVFEGNNPALSKGFLTYQLCGLAFWCEEVAGLLAGEGVGGADAAADPGAGGGVAMATVRIHGHDVFYRADGEGSPVVLIHGIAGCSATWDAVVPRLAPKHAVIAPDLLGHGESAKPRGDYSLGAYASGVRDLLAVLGHERVTVVGHSLGGGIAMQFAYQFPERCERLVLVGSGGLGKEVSPLLRALSAPGAEYLLALLLARRLHGIASAVGSTVGKLGVRGDQLMTELWNSYTRLTDARAQRAFFHTIRSVIDPAGQRVSARDRLYLAADVPTLVVWGDRDSVIPVEHAHVAHDLIPGSRLEIFPGCGHFVPIEAPERFVEVLEDFLDTTEPAELAPHEWQELLTSSTTAASA